MAVPSGERKYLGKLLVWLHLSGCHVSHWLPLHRFDVVHQLDVFLQHQAFSERAAGLWAMPTHTHTPDNKQNVPWIIL